MTEPRALEVGGRETGTAPRPVVSIVLVTWNGWSLLQRCLRSLAGTGQLGPDVEVVVVDNGSTDGTAAGLAREFPMVRYLPQTDNLGFARANNIGVAAATSDLLFLLNNDTVVQSDTVMALLGAALAYPEFHVFVPEMLRLSAPAIVDNRGVYLDRTGHFRQLDSGRSSTASRSLCEVFGASGGACLLRSDVVRRIGLFDETLESYLEDCDFAARARATGFRALYVPASRVLHEGSATGLRMAEHTYFLIQRNMWATWRRWLELAPWRASWWFGVAYEAFQGVKAARAGRGRLFLRAKLEGAALVGAARNRRAIRQWIGVRGRPVRPPNEVAV